MGEQSGEEGGGVYHAGGGLGPLSEEQARSRPMLQHLPFFRVWKPSFGDASSPQMNPGWLGESCGARLILGTAGGAGMGLLFGMFLGAMGDMQPIQLLNGREVPQAPLREQARAAYLGTATRSVSLAKNFASFSAIFMGSECVIEKMRAKQDMMNSIYAGCVTGAAFGIKSGPQAAAFGCAGMAAFSGVIDLVMGH
jgi:import inner membrane translocase subunit TIM22